MSSVCEKMRKKDGDEERKKETIKIHEHCSLLPRILIVIEEEKKFFAFLLSIIH